MLHKIQDLIKSFSFLDKRDFLMGIGSAMNLCGNYYDEAQHSILDKTDVEALASDWKRVGQILRDYILK